MLASLVATHELSDYLEPVSRMHVTEGGQPHDVELPEEVAPLLRRHRLHSSLALTLRKNLGVRIAILKLRIDMFSQFEVGVGVKKIWHLKSLELG